MERRRHPSLIWRGGCLLFIFFLSVALFPVTSLEIRDKKEDRVLYSKRISSGDRFEFIYLHSVDKTPVMGYFLITPDKRIQPIETRFQSYGPGLPSAEKHTLGEGKELKVKSEGIVMERFSFFVSPMTRQTFIFKGERIDFSSLQEGAMIDIEVTFRPLFWEVFFSHGRSS